MARLAGFIVDSLKPVTVQAQSMTGTLLESPVLLYLLSAPQGGIAHSHMQYAHCTMSKKVNFNESCQETVQRDDEIRIGDCQNRKIVTDKP